MKSADASLDVVYGFWYRQAWHIGAYYEPRGGEAQVVIDAVLHGLTTWKYSWKTSASFSP